MLLLLCVCAGGYILGNAFYNMMNLFVANINLFANNRSGEVGARPHLVRGCLACLLAVHLSVNCR